jgi:hypothetical protein
VVLEKIELEPRPEELIEYGDAETAFVDWAEVWPQGWDNLDVAAAEVNGKIVSLRTLLKEMAGDQRAMDARCCDSLGMPYGSTYDDAVTKIKYKLGLS